MRSTKARQILICAVQFDKELKSGELSAVDLAPLAARLGAQGVEYRDLYWRDRATEIPVVKAQLADLRLTGIYATFTTLFNKDTAKQAQLMQDLEDAHAIGSPLMRVFRGETPTDSAEGAAMLSAALAVVERAGQYGMRLALENHSGALGSSLADVREVLDRLASPVMGTNVDIANYALNGQEPIAAIRDLSPWIIYSHLKDVKPAAEGPGTTYLGNGILPLRDIISAFEATGRGAPLCFEFRGEGNPEEEIAASMRCLAGI